MTRTGDPMHTRGYALSTAQYRRSGAEAIALGAFIVAYQTGTSTATTRVLTDLDAKACKHG